MKPSVNHKVIFFTLLLCLVSACLAKEKPLATTAVVVSKTVIPHLAEAEQAAKAIIAACPIARPDDVSARDACGNKLSKNPYLVQASKRQTEILWGGHDPKKHKTFDPAQHDLTGFEPYAWRFMYLSLFMFDGKYSVQAVDGYTVVRLSVSFRYNLPKGEYPYPFWHIMAKWEAYLHATEILILFDSSGQVFAVYRFGKDNSRPNSEREKFDGNWTWIEQPGSQQEPRVSQGKYIFSANNPFAQEAAEAYRAIEREFRTVSCDACHTPSNPAKMKKLYLLMYPNQALGARDKLLEVFEENSMPQDGGLSETVRLKMLDLARVFKNLADKAVSWELMAPR